MISTLRYCILYICLAIIALPSYGISFTMDQDSELCRWQLASLVQLEGDGGFGFGDILNGQLNGGVDLNGVPNALGAAAQAAGSAYDDGTIFAPSMDNPPDAVDDTGADLQEDGANGAINILTNDTDPDGDPTAPTNGTGQFTIDLNVGTTGLQVTDTDASGVWNYDPTTGVITFDPANNFTGTATHIYQLCDIDGLCNSAFITFEVLPVNDASVAGDDTYYINEDAVLNGSVAGNDSDVDNANDDLTWSIVDGGTAATNGTLTMFANGSFSYTPNVNFAGTVSFIYQVCDLGPLCTIATATINVAQIADPPDAINDVGATLTEDAASGSINIIINDTDPDGNPTVPTNGVGQFVVDLDINTTGVQLTNTITAGTWSYAPATGIVTFVPAANYNGTAQIAYQLCDPTGACDFALISFVVTPVNDPPDAVNDNGGVLIEDGANGTVNIIANDTDPDGNPTAPTNGLNQFRVDLNTTLAGIQLTRTTTDGVWTYTQATGIVTFDPADNYFGTATIPYQVCDPSLLCDVANITFIVSPENDAPNAVDDIVTPALLEDGPNGTVNILANDTDIDGTISAPTNDAGLYAVDLDPGTVGVQTAISNAQGEWTYNTATGVVTFNPADNYFGTATIPYVLCDPDGACDQANITFTVTSVNDLPDAIADLGADLIEDGANGVINILANDTDPDGDPFAPTNGAGQFTVDLDPNTTGIQTTFTNATGVWTYDPSLGIVTFDPANNYYGTAQIGYILCDPAGGCDQTNITFTVWPVNDPPIVNDDYDNTTPNSIVFSNVIANDNDALDPNGGIDVTSITIINGPFNGTAGAQANGSISYLPDLDYVGLDSLQYVVCDLGFPTPVICDTAWFFITVDDLFPLATDDVAFVNEDGSVVIDVLDNDTTPVGVLVLDSLAIIDPPLNGTVVINPDGTITYTPNPNFNGSDDFTYTICNDAGYCSNATVTIEISAVNDAPVAVNDTITTNEDVAVVINVIGNDTDPADPNGGIEPTSINVINGPFNGTVVVNGDGTITYTPGTNFFGIDSLQYVVCDTGVPLPSLCDTAYVFIYVDPVNDPPFVSDPVGGSLDTLAVSTFLNTPFTVCLNAFDVDGDPIDVTGALNGPTNGAITGLNNNDTCFIYTPDPGFVGQDTVDIVVCDNQGACDTVTVVITVLPNQPPVIVDDGGLPIDTIAVTTTEETAVFICLNAIDPDGDAVDATNALSGPLSGSVSGLANGDTCFTYSPNNDFYGTDTVVVQVCDGSGACDDVTVIITVTPINDPPFALNDTVSINEDATTIINVIANDNDDADGNGMDPGSVTIIGGPVNGTATTNGDGTITYDPDPNFNGSDTITYVICDQGVPLPAICDTAVVYINVDPVNDPPVITDDGGLPTDTVSVSTLLDVPVTICFNASDVEGDPLDASSTSNGPANGTMSGVNDGDTCVTYTPDPGFFGNDTVTVFICDAQNACDPVVVVITVIPNQPPVIVDDGGSPIDTLLASTLEETATFICLSAVDPDGDTVDVTAALSGPMNGSVSGLANGDTCFTYVPEVDFVGNDTIVIQVCDGAGACDDIVVIMNVTPVNDPPVVNDDAVTTLEDTQITIDVLNNDNDDSDGSPLDPTSVTVIGGPQNGTATVNTDGTILYVPDTDFNGNDTIVYVICDTGVPLPALCDTASVVITVTPVNDPPVVVVNGTPVDTIFASGTMDATLVICLDAIDAENDPVDVTQTLSGPLNGTVTNLADGDTCFTYTPDPGYTGGDTLVVVVCDPFNGCDTVVIVIDIPSNNPPMAVDDTASVDGGGSVVIPNEANDSDPDGDPFTTTTATAVNGTVVINGDGTLTYTPNPNFCGTDTISYTICDGSGACDSAIIPVVVNCGPVVVDDTVVTDEDTDVVIDVTGNDFDPNGDPFSVTTATATNGTVTVNGDGTITYSPNPNYCGEDIITYTVCDDTGLCSSGSVFVTVICVNDPPIAVDDTGSGTQGGEVTVDVLDNDSDVDGDPLTVTDVTATNGTVTINNDGTITYVPNEGFCGLDTITYTVCDPTPMCDVGQVFVEIECVEDVIAIPQGFSPNGDNIGDVWFIEGLDRYPNSSIKIFNRWGNIVFEDAPYQNNWTGQNMNDLSLGDDLPNGTYWYILDLGNDEEPRAGYVYISR